MRLLFDWIGNIMGLEVVGRRRGRNLHFALKCEPCEPFDLSVMFEMKFLFYLIRRIVI